MTDSQPVPEQRSWNLEPADFSNFAKKTKLQGKFELPEKREFEKKKKDSHPQADSHS